MIWVARIAAVYLALVFIVAFIGYRLGQTHTASPQAPEINRDPGHPSLHLADPDPCPVVDLDRPSLHLVDPDPCPVVDLDEYRTSHPHCPAV